MGNTEGKIERKFDPRNDSGVEIPGWPKGHNTPALILADDDGIESIRQAKLIWQRDTQLVAIR